MAAKLAGIGMDFPILETGVAAAISAGLLTGVYLLVCKRLRDQNRRLHDLCARRGKRLGRVMRMMKLAEDLAQLGVWQYDLLNDQQHWSPGLLRLFGMNHSEKLLPGDAETLLLCNGGEVLSQISENHGKRSSYTFDFIVDGYDGVNRILRMHAANKWDRSGMRNRVFGVVIDVTEQRLHERALAEAERDARIMAEEAQTLANTDHLTGLPNRRHLLRDLDSAVMRANGNGSRLSLIVFDIDHFKGVNDNYGHPAGDAILRKIAKIAQSAVRNADTIGRIGGEEFAWIVPGADAGRAHELAERLRRAIEAKSATDGVPGVTISLGISEHRSGDAALGLFARADEALYHAKESGRNRSKLAA